MSGSRDMGDEPVPRTWLTVAVIVCWLYVVCGRRAAAGVLSRSRGHSSKGESTCVGTSVEQRHRALLAVLVGSLDRDGHRSGTGLSEPFQVVDALSGRRSWGLVDRPRWLGLEAAVCELRREQPRWGPRRLATAYIWTFRGPPTFLQRPRAWPAAHNPERLSVAASHLQWASFAGWMVLRDGDNTHRDLALHLLRR
jgi:hypothetical protein